MALPQFIVMRSGVTGKYLQYGKGKGSALSSTLGFSHEAKRSTLPSSEGLESLKEKMATSEKKPLEFHLLKFEVEEAKTVPGFVHIRTCYNNKYLVRESKEGKRVVAEAHEVEENQTKWWCTLFKPVFLGEVAEDDEEGRGCVFGSNKHGIGMVPQKIQLMHVAMGEEYYVSAESMELVQKEEAIMSMTVSDVTASVQLPQYVLFKSHDGSKYLGSPDWFYQYFNYTDMADQGVAMVNLNSGSGPTDVAIFSGTETEGGKWDTASAVRGLVVALFKDSPCLYTPVKVNNYVALYSSYGRQFIQRDPSDGCFVALSANISEEAQLQVGEPVVSRTIKNITYDLENARVYNTTDVTKISDSRKNYTDHEDTGSLSKDYTMSRTMTWNQSISVSIGMSMSLSFGIPDIGIGGEISLNYDISESFEWGQEDSKSETVTHEYDFDVPPMTMQTKTVVAANSFCDVPFTCDVDDLLVSGHTNSYTLTDCWFTGANDYNAVEETHDEPLPPA